MVATDEDQLSDLNSDAKDYTVEKLIRPDKSTIGKKTPTLSYENIEAFHNLF